MHSKTKLETLIALDRENVSNILDFVKNSLPTKTWIPSLWKTPEKNFIDRLKKLELPYKKYGNVGSVKNFAMQAML